MPTYARTTIIAVRTFANRDGDAEGDGTYGVAFNPTSVVATVTQGGAVQETFTADGAGVDEEWVEVGDVTTGEYRLVYTPPAAGRYRVRVEGAWTRSDGQPGYSAEEAEHVVS